MNTSSILVTKAWLDQVVIGLNLCPFAKKPFINNQIRYVVCKTDNLAELNDLLVQELLFLQKTPAKEVETTLIILLQQLQDFDSYWNYIYFAGEIIKQLSLEGELQLASFHPDYQFHGSEKDDVTNYTNRSPYPLIHILREESLETALEHYPNPEEIPERNTEKMTALGIEKMTAYFEKIKLTS